MKLIDVAASLATLDESLFIGARRPWHAQCDVSLAPIGPDGRFPEQVRQEGFEYFLEVSTALEVCEVFAGKPASTMEKALLLLHYAEYDAYPDWVYDA